MLYRSDKLFRLALAALLVWPLAAITQTPSAHAYLWRNVVIGGGGFVDGIVFHPTEKNLVYARTDVGGAYCWDEKDHEWVALNDWLNADQNNYTGIESIGLDPADPNRVYLAAGTYSRGGAAILRSNNRGKSFQITEVSFRMGGNEDGRSNGERLAVDPNDGNILFFGSRRDGLWKSADRAATWQRVNAFTNLGTTQTFAVPTNNAPGRRRGFGNFNTAYGIIAVVFDAFSGKRGLPTPVVYTAVSTTGTNFYRSDNAGATWQPVAGQPIGLRPNHVIQSPDGFFYLTYGNVPGPNNVTDGAVWKFSSKDGSWTNISPNKLEAGLPLGWGYGAVTVDAQHPATIVVTTMDRWKMKDELFRSTDGGASWKGILVEDGELDFSFAPYTRGRTPHWPGTLAVNPHNSDQILFGTGYGIWASVNATAADSGQRVKWIFLDQGLEETVPLALISPPEGAHLLSGIGDIDGFRHDDLTVSPADGTFHGVRYGNTEDLAFAGKNPNVIVRCGTANSQAVRAAYSLDGGISWQAFFHEPSNGGAGAGSIAISADARIVVWTPRRSGSYWTTNWGTNWTACAGLPAGLRIIADPMNPQKFYAYNTSAGRVLTSTNGAVNFSATAASFPAAEGTGFRGGSSALCAVPGMEGDLWLASRNDGLFHSTNGGAEFVKCPGVPSASSLGFGKAAAGKDFPVLFLAGSVGLNQSLFRSDDFGASWQRINDDEHQFGFIGRVTGDPRVFGRVYFATGGRGIIYGDPSDARFGESFR